MFSDEAHILRSLQDDGSVIVLHMGKKLSPVMLERSWYMHHCLSENLLNVSDYQQLTEGEANFLRSHAWYYTITKW